MKKALKCLSVIIVMLIILFSFSITALAQTTTQDGLQVNLTTDKQSYSLNEDIKITVSVTNTNDFTVKDVSIEALLPDKFELKDSNDETSTKAIDLKSGEQANLIVVAVVKGEEQNVTKPTENTVEPSTVPDDTTEPSTVSDDTTEPTTKSTESNADNTQNTKPNTQTTTSSISNNDNNNSDKSDDNTKNNNNQDNTSIKTGSDYIYMGIFIVLLLASISTLLYCLIKHFNKTTKIISSILCVVIAVTSVVGISKFNAFAQENTTTITLNEHIKVDNCDYTISANVDYVSVSKEKWFKDVEENHIVKSDTGEEYIDNRIIVLFTPETTEEQKQNVVKFVNGEIIGNDDGSKYQIQIETTENLEELEEICLSVSRMPGVLWCFYETVYEVSKATEQLKAVPNDPWKDTFQGIWGTDWNEENPGGLNWWLETIQAPSAWDYNNRFNSIKIGVVDNGFDIDHEDLKINLINPNENSSDKNKKNHGTHVAGIIGATANNEKGITGIVWNKDLYCADVVATKKQENEHISILNSIDGIEETLKKGCKIVNLSIGDNLNNNAVRILKNGRNTTALLLYWDRYIKDDFIIVQSAGNEKTDCTNNGSFSSITRESIDYVFDNQDEIWPGLDISFREEYSADDIYKHIIIVGATDKPSSKNEYKLTDFSNYGDNISIVAPGKDIFSTIYSGGINGNYGYNDGTSMAAPIVSGVTALVWSVNPNFTSDEVKNIVCNSYNKTANGYVKSDNRAYPIVNAKFAVEEAIRRTDNKGVATGAFVDIKTKVHVKDVTMKCIRYTGELSGYALSDFDIKTVDGIFYQELYEGTYEYKIEANDYTLDRTVIIVVRKGKTTDKGTIELISTTGSVCAGIVKDSKTNNPIKDVRVEVIDNSSDSLDPVATTTTDENGNFSLNLPYGSYSLSFHHDNYNYYGTSLEVDSEYVILQNPVLLNPTTSENLIQNNDIVTLTGILKTEDYEINSNNKGTVTILDLDNPIKCYLKDGNNYDGKTEYNIKSVQISSPDLKEYIGQNVTVKGKVMLAHTAHHRRDVVLLESEVIKLNSIENYKEDFINALLENEDEWYVNWGASVGYQSELTFTDLNFDGKPEFIMQYGGGSMRNNNASAYYFSNNKLFEANTWFQNNLTAYYDKSNNSYVMLGNAYAKDGVNYWWCGDFELSFDGINIISDYYSSYIAEDLNYTGNFIYTYYNGANGYGDVNGLSKITETEYNKINEEKLKNLVNINMKREFILCSDWEKYSASEKRQALEKAYDSFTYDKY